MSESSFALLGTAILAVLLAGYFGQKYLPNPTPQIVGIDLGTTYSSIGVYHSGSGEVEIFADNQGRKIFPSIVAFKTKESPPLIGYYAQQQIDLNSQNSFFDAKRFIGKKFTASDLQNEAKRYSFNIAHENDAALFETTWNQRISPEQIGAYLISYMKGLVEKRLKVSVTKGIISVPAEFDAEQRNATIKAAKLAGIEILRVINEPTAAALAYGLHKKEGVQNVLIVDLGGGTLDVSLLMVQGGMFLTRSMAGNNHLGGQDFNQRLIQYLKGAIAEKFDETLKNMDDLQTLAAAVESAKIALTESPEVEMKIYFEQFETNFTYALTRETFELINSDLFKEVLRPIEAALADVEVEKDEVDDIVLVGGSTRIPKIRQIISEYFGGKKLQTGVDPELAVVSGVAIEAGIVGGAWPLQVSATELPANLRKIHVYSQK